MEIVYFLSLLVYGCAITYIIHKRLLPFHFRITVIVFYMITSLATVFLLFKMFDKLVYIDILMSALAVYISWYIARYKAAPLWMRRMFIGVGMAMGLFLGFELVRLYMSLR